MGDAGGNGAQKVKPVMMLECSHTATSGKAVLEQHGQYLVWSSFRSQLPCGSTRAYAPSSQTPGYNVHRANSQQMYAERMA